MTEQMVRRSGCRVRSAMVRVDAAVLWENTTFKHRPGPARFTFLNVNLAFKATPATKPAFHSKAPI